MVSCGPNAEHEKPTLEAMAGQMIMIGFPGSSAREKWPNTVASQIEKGTVGGVLMLGYNFKSKEEVLGLTRLFHDAGKKTAFQPFIALDQEGGLVQRLGRKIGYPPAPSAREIAATQSPEEARAVFDRLAIDCVEAGFNVNLAPVVDLEIDAANPGVGGARRSYGDTPEKVIAYAEEFITSQQSQGLLPVLKHFPGHGSSVVDPHVHFADISESWRPEEMEPFKVLGAMTPPPAIMVGHLLHGDLAGKEPASLSSKAIREQLRGKLGFNGLVICDDLQMPAILKSYTLDEALILAIQAGVDIIMITNTVTPDPLLPEKLVSLICQAVGEGRLEQRLVEEAFERIIKTKAALGQK